MARITLGSFAAGAAAMYFADPDRERRRRAGVRDGVAAKWRDMTREIDKAERDLWNRAHGIGAAVSSRWNETGADGPVLVERVRSAIGRAVSHPHAIRVRSEENGRVVLEGPVLRHEVDYLLRRTRAVAGVGEVINQLEIHDDSSGTPSLQGGVPRRGLSELAQQRWTPSLRVAAAASGGMILLASSRRNRLTRWIGRLGGGLLLARAVANRPLQEIIGNGEAGVVNFEKTIHVQAPVDEVYSFWENFENFPRFMSHLKEVRHLRNGLSHWVAAGPGGISIPWDAEVTERHPKQLLAWKSVPGSVLRTAGMVRFDSEPDGRTRVQIRMSYCPPAGLFGHAIACLFGADPKTEIDRDLVRMKMLLETGRTRAHRAVITREQVAIGATEPQQQA